MLTPAYPGFEVEVEALREDPIGDRRADCPRDVDHLGEVIERPRAPPIIMGHSFGGTLTQLLLDRGFGAAGVMIDSAPTEGVHVNPPSQIKSLSRPQQPIQAAQGGFGFTPEQFHYAFTNTFSAEESHKVYDRYHIPAPAAWLWAYGLIANFKPGHQETWVNYSNDSRAPLLFITGGADNIMPPSVSTRTRSTTSRHASRRSSTSRAAPTGPAANLAGRRSPTTRSSGRRNAHAQDRSSALRGPRSTNSAHPTWGCPFRRVAP